MCPVLCGNRKCFLFWVLFICLLIANAFFTSVQCAYKLDNHNGSLLFFSLYRKIKAIKMSCLGTPTKFNNKRQLIVYTYERCKEITIKHGRSQWPKGRQPPWENLDVQTGIHGVKHLLPNYHSKVGNHVSVHPFLPTLGIISLLAQG